MITKLRWLTVVWPGLAQLWLQGAWSGLFLAAGFSVLLNVAILSTWVWVELLTAPFRLLAWGGVILFWLASLASSIVQVPKLLRVPSAALSQDLFAAAQAEYLKGNWFEAEVALNRLLEHDPSDVDAHLMLATLLRRTGNGEEAKERLRWLARLDGAGKWQLEVAREWQMLRTAAVATAQNVHLHNEADAGLPKAA